MLAPIKKKLVRTLNKTLSWLTKQLKNGKMSKNRSLWRKWKRMARLLFRLLEKNWLWLRNTSLLIYLKKWFKKKSMYPQLLNHLLVLEELFIVFLNIALRLDLIMNKELISCFLLKYLLLSALFYLSLIILNSNKKFTKSVSVILILIWNIESLLTKESVTSKIDDSGQSIGRRYARTDECGIPFAITVDFDTLEDNTVTLRDLDTMKQVRMKVIFIIKVNIKFNIDWWIRLEHCLVVKCTETLGWCS